jgi:hypothetical protein
MDKALAFHPYISKYEKLDDKQKKKYLDVYKELLEVYSPEILNLHMYPLLLHANNIIHGKLDYITDEIIWEIYHDEHIPNIVKSNMLLYTEWVYVLGNKEMGLYKIGMTKRTPSQRTKEFSPKLPFKTKILLRCPTLDAYSLESKLHDMFSDKRTNGEWFSLSEGDMVYIASLSI